MAWTIIKSLAIKVVFCLSLILCVKTYNCFIHSGRLATPQEIDLDAQSADWVSVRYRRNRGILHDGNFPHQSTPVTEIPAGVRRVILGFNCFPVELSECNLRAPEHSDAFNRTVRLYQTMASIGVPVTATLTAANGQDKYSGTSLAATKIGDVDEKAPTAGGKKSLKKGFSVADLKSNPALARLLVTAAKTLKAKELSDKSLIR